MNSHCLLQTHMIIPWTATVYCRHKTLSYGQPLSTADTHDYPMHSHCLLQTHMIIPCTATVYCRHMWLSHEQPLSTADISKCMATINSDGLPNSRSFWSSGLSAFHSTTFTNMDLINELGAAITEYPRIIVPLQGRLPKEKELQVSNQRRQRVGQENIYQR